LRLANFPPCIVVAHPVATAVSEEPPPPEVFELLADEHARAILTATTGERISAPMLADTIDAARSTVYDRTDRLLAAGLLDERTRLDEDGNHHAAYGTRMERISVRLTSDGFDVETERPTGTPRPTDSRTCGVISDDPGDGPGRTDLPELGTAASHAGGRNRHRREGGPRYRQNRDRAMLLLAAGLGLLVLAPPVVELWAVWPLPDGDYVVEFGVLVAEAFLRLSGAVFILASMYVER